MTTGSGALDAALEQRRRDELREEMALEEALEQRRRDELRGEMRDQYDAGLDRVPSSRQERYDRQMGRDADDDDSVRAARMGASGILGEM